MDTHQESQKPHAADVHLIDLVGAALVDPSLHTDARMRLHRDLTELIESARHDLSGPAISEAPRLSAEPPDGELAEVVAARELTKVLSAVLVDPDLHTDTRLRLREEIHEMIRAAHQGAAVQ